MRPFELNGALVPVILRRGRERQAAQMPAWRVYVGPDFHVHGVMLATVSWRPRREITEGEIAYERTWDWRWWTGWPLRVLHKRCAGPFSAWTGRDVEVYGLEVRLGGYRRVIRARSC